MATTKPKPKPTATVQQVADPETIREELANASLWAKIMWVQSSVKHVEKTGHVEFSGASYDVMQEHGLIAVLQVLMDVAGLGSIFGATEPGSLHRDGNMHTLDAALTVFDATGHEVTRWYPNIGVDSRDKGPNKAWTGGHKYALQKFFKVPTVKIDQGAGFADNDDPGEEATPQRQENGVSAQERTALTQILQKGIEDGHFTKSWVTNTLAAQFRVDKIAQLAPADFERFGTLVADRIAGETTAG